MAEIDSRIYLQAQGPDIIGGIKTGLEYRANKEQRERQNAELDAKKLKEKQLFDTQEIAKVAHGVNDQATYDKALEYLGTQGVDTSKVPKAYDPQVVGMYKKAAMSYQDQLGQDWKEKEYQLAQEKLRDASKDRAEARQSRLFNQGLVREEKKEKLLGDNVQKLSKDLTGTQGIVHALDGVETELGSKIDDFQIDNDELKVKKNGQLQKIDLPGVSVPGLGRFTAFNSKARNLNTAASSVFNAELKDRSGSTVTDSELERLKTEFGSGKYNTEAELVQALKKYKERAVAVMGDREAGYAPEVVARYTDQGGRTTKTFPKAKDGYENMSEEELASLIQQRSQGAKNANSR